MSRIKGTISGIAYLSAECFLARANVLKEQGLIPDVFAIAHKGEFDPLKGKRDKDHLHFLIPFSESALTDTDRLTDLWGSQTFPDGSRGSVAKGEWRRCKSVADWWYYSVHDECYLKAKREDKEFHYRWEDFIATVGPEQLATVREYWRSHPPRLGNSALSRALIKRASEEWWSLHRFCREWNEAGLPANMYPSAKQLFIDVLASAKESLYSRDAQWMRSAAVPFCRDFASPGEGGDSE